MLGLKASSADWVFLRRSRTPKPGVCRVGCSSTQTEALRGRHPCADLLELFDRYAVEAALAAGLLDGPDDHPTDERGDLLHARGGRIVPGHRRRRFNAVLNRRRRLAEAP